VAYVAGAWGIRGAVKVVPQSADAEALLHAKRWWLMSPQAAPGARRQWPVDVIQVRHQGDALVATLQGVVDRNLAESLQGVTVHVPRSAFPATPTDEFYWVDLIGCRVLNRDGADLGLVTGLIDTGAHSVLQVASAGQVERLIPFVSAYVGRTDVVAKVIEVDWDPAWGLEA
jgi:16S rRNA processing protein RimM